MLGSWIAKAAPLACRWAVVIFGLALTAPAASAAPLNAQDTQIAQRWAANNAMFVLYHEMAHLLVDQLNLPVLGREEDAADNMATHILLSQRTNEADQALVDAARGWLLTDAAGPETFQTSDFYDSHSLNLQRAYAIVCMMVGSDRNAFGRIADVYGIDPFRQDSCAGDFNLIDRSVDRVMAAYGAPDTRDGGVKVHYEVATGLMSRAAVAFKRSGVFEKVADTLDKDYRLRRSVVLRAQLCDQPNAFYDPNHDEIIFCYELMHEFLDMARQDMAYIRVNAPETSKKVNKKARHSP